MLLTAPFRHPHFHSPLYASSPLFASPVQVSGDRRLLRAAGARGGRGRDVLRQPVHWWVQGGGRVQRWQRAAPDPLFPRSPCLASPSPGLPTIRPLAQTSTTSSMPARTRRGGTRRTPRSWSSSWRQGGREGGGGGGGVAGVSHEHMRLGQARGAGADQLPPACPSLNKHTHAHTHRWRCTWTVWLA